MKHSEETKVFELAKNIVSSEELLFDLGFQEVIYEFYMPKIGETIESIDNFGALFQGAIVLDHSITHHKRSIYTVWDFLGDVGGLFDMLKLLA